MARDKYVKVQPYIGQTVAITGTEVDAVEQLRRPLVRSADHQDREEDASNAAPAPQEKTMSARSFGVGVLGGLRGAGRGRLERQRRRRAGARRRVPRRSAVTYTKHVAPILQRSCQTCHRPGTNAPMSLLTYEDVRPWARAIKARVTARIMPPWHIERNVGIQQFKDDPSLTDAGDRDHRGVVRRRRAARRRRRPAAGAVVSRRRGVAHRHAGSDRRDSQEPRRAGECRRPVDRLHRGFRTDRGSLPPGGGSQARPRRARGRASPADVSDPGSGRRRSAVGPSRRSRHQQRELPQRICRRQERRLSCRRAPRSW